MLILPLLLPSVTFGQESKEENGHNEELWSAVKPLSTITSFLNTGAHPDDERSHLLAYLSRGLGVHTASLIANRGEGGQNEIGEELGNALGIIRSREMIEASEVTGVEAFHLSETTSDPIYDFGFSKSPDDTLNIWGEDVTYERFIRLIRQFKPDIVMPAFLDVESQHGHHRAITQLSLKAFEDAADPDVFPQHSEIGLDPWQIKKIYLPVDEEEATIGFEIGDYDPVYDMTYPQLGEESRYLHKSQGMGNDIEPGSQMQYLQLAESVVGDQTDEQSIFQGLHYDFYQYAADLSKSDNKIKGHLQNLQKQLNQVIKAYPDSDTVLEEAHQALKQVRKTKERVESFTFDEVDKNDLLHRLDIKEEQLTEVSQVASQLDVTTTVAKPTLTQGDQTSVTVELENHGQTDLTDVSVDLNAPRDWDVSNATNVDTLDSGATTSVEFDVGVADAADFYDPYAEDTISAQVTYQVDNESITFVDTTEETTAVLPEVGLKANPGSLAINTAKDQEEIEIDVEVTNNTNDNLTTDIGLQVPDGWENVDSKTVSLGTEDGETTVTFNLTPPEGIDHNSSLNITPVATVDEKQLSTSIQVISYDHIGTFYYLTDASIDVSAFDLQFDDDLRVGYVESGFDTVADSLTEVGMDVTKIEDFGSADLSNYDTVVVGIRAYLSREDLLEHNDRLLEFAENGGNVVVQYHKPWDNWDSETTAPYPLTLGEPSIEWRVTDEDSDYEILQPEHPLFNQPNEITENDWSGWIQDRGLYYPMEWDNQYETLLTMTDLDGDTFESGILVTDYGEGSYIYSNLVWYRQIQGLVPGGYRTFTNLISYDGSQE